MKFKALNQSSYATSLNPQREPACGINLETFSMKFEALNHAELAHKAKSTEAASLGSTLRLDT